MEESVEVAERASNGLPESRLEALFRSLSRLRVELVASDHQRCAVNSAITRTR